MSLVVRCWAGFWWPLIELGACRVRVHGKYGGEGWRDGGREVVWRRSKKFEDEIRSHNLKSGLSTHGSDLVLTKSVVSSLQRPTCKGLRLSL